MGVGAAQYLGVEHSWQLYISTKYSLTSNFFKGIPSPYTLTNDIIITGSDNLFIYLIGTHLFPSLTLFLVASLQPPQQLFRS